MADKPVTLMAVHAHPDDEVVFTGGTLLAYHNRGVRTVLVTATLGEEGEIRDPDLDPDASRPRLGEIRREELRRGIEILKIDDLELLGYRDSGMAGTEANARPDNFHNADKEVVTARLVELIRKYRPEVLVTYDEFGAYGHPDHIACNVVTHMAYDRAGDPAYRPDLGKPWQPLKLYYTAWAEENMEKARSMYIERGLKWPWDEEEQQNDPDPQHQSVEEGLAEHQVEFEKAEGDPGDEQPEEAEEKAPAKEEEKKPEYVPPPVTARIDVRDVLAEKRRSIIQHRTQFAADGLFLTIPDDIAEVAFGEEHYSLVRSHVQGPERETDLLEGLPAPGGASK